MSSKASEVLEIIQNEAERSRAVQDVFNQAFCLLETHYTGRPSSLLEVYPGLRGQKLSETEVARLDEALVRFVEEASAHECVTAAIKLLALSKDKKFQGFFVDQMRVHLAWRSSPVVFQLLLALEDLGEEVFFDAEGNFVRSRSSNAFDANFDMARRYLQKYDKSR